MTGGIVTVLGPIGLNFGSGMTGGLAYVLRNAVENILNIEFVQPHELDEQEEHYLRGLLEKHLALTDSPVAFRYLAMRHCHSCAFSLFISREPWKPPGTASPRIIVRRPAAAPNYSWA